MDLADFKSVVGWLGRPRWVQFLHAPAIYLGKEEVSMTEQTRKRLTQMSSKAG